MIDGKVKGYFLLGQNPAVGSAHGKAQRLGMANLDWLVVRDLFEIESATFWKDSPGDRDRRDRARGVPHRGVPPAGRLARGEGGHVHPDPADAAVAREGGRAAGRLPLRAVVLLPPRPDGPGAAGRLHRRARTAPLLDLAWDYPVHGEHDEPSAEAVLKEINGYEVATGRPLSTFTELKDDGSTAGRLLDLHRRLRRRRQPGRPAQARQRAVLGGPRVGLGVAGEPAHPLQPGLGRPGRQAVERAQGLRLVGRGEPASGPATTCPTSRRPSRRRTARPRAPTASRRSPATTRSSCRATGRAGSTCPQGLIDGPLPTHYEPVESPVRNPLYGQQGNPTRKDVRPRRTTRSTRARRSDAQRGLPVRVHDQPAHRAPHGRRR